MSRSELQSYIISAKTTNADTLKKWGYQVTKHPGVYVSKKPFFKRVNIILLNQLRNTAHNHYFQLFASKKKVRETAMASLLQQHEQAFWANQTGNVSDSTRQLSDAQLNEQWNVLYAIRKIYGMEGIRMETEMTLEEVLEMGRQEYRRSIIESSPVKERIAGLELQEVMAQFEPREVVAQFEPREVVAELAPKDRVDGLDPKEIIEALEPKNMSRLVEEIENFLAKQKASMEYQPETSESENLDEEANTEDGVQN